VVDCLREDRKICSSKVPQDPREDRKICRPVEKAKYPMSCFFYYIDEFAKIKVTNINHLRESNGWSLATLTSPMV
jgi:hypothetical protein